MTVALPDSTQRDNLPASVPLLDVNRGNALLRDEILEAIARVVDSGRFLYGPDVSRLEETLAAICDTRHAIGCASGSDALLLALMAFDVGPGDEVIVPSFTFFATASCVWRLGARVVFADIDPVTFNLDPAKVEEALTPATRAIIPVHLYGQCADMDALLEIARHNDLKVIEDAAQSVGAEYRGHPAGSLGDCGCISFYPTKNLGGYGDGGMVVTKDESLAEKIRRLAAHGMKTRYYHSQVGINSRLDSMQAAVLNVKLERSPGKRPAVSPAVYGGAFGPAADPAQAAAGPLSRLESVYDLCTGRPPRRAANPTGRTSSGLGNLLPRPAASAGMLPHAGLSPRQLACDRTLVPGSLELAHLSRTHRGRTGSRGGSDPRLAAERADRGVNARPRSLLQGRSSLEFTLQRVFVGVHASACPRWSSVDLQHDLLHGDTFSIDDGGPFRADFSSGDIVAD